MNILARARPVATVGFNLKPIRGPYGGGNQWAGQLSRHLEHEGWATRFDLRKKVDAVLLTHAGTSAKMRFDLDALREVKSRHPSLPVIQRINDNDRRKGTSEMNAILAETNALATHTVFVSAWLRDHHAGLWFDPARPHSVMTNGADPAAFHPIGSRPLAPGEPLRLVTHHWSDNWIKGFALYREIDRLIATGALPGVELWVIGRWPAEIEWQAARTFPPTSGRPLGDLLRQCHACVTASLWEPGAMHPVEALACGLPLLYHEDTGGTVELGREFGIAFRNDIASAIGEIRTRLADLRARVLADAPSGDLMCLQYRRLLQRLIAER